MAGELYISNLAGTFDYQEILNLYYQSQSAPINLLKSQESKLSEKESALKEFNSNIQKFYEAFNSLTSSYELEKKNVSISNPSVLSANVLDPLSAQEGSYTVEVNQLAKNDVWLSQKGVSSLSDPVSTTSGQLTIEYEGQSVAVVDYDEDTSDNAKPSTLTEIANAINSSQDKVVASVIFDGSSYRLLLSGKDTGEKATISIKETGNGDLLDNLELGDNYSESHVQVAQDAKITLFGAEINSSTNTFEDAIPGVKITVNSIGTSVINVQADYSQFRNDLTSLINAYNAIVDFISDKAGKDGVLSGDNTLYTVRSSLLSKIQSLFDLGILSVDKDTGHVNLNTSKLDTLLSQNLTEVKTAVSNLRNSLQDYLVFLTSPEGPINSEIKSLESAKEQIEDRIDFMTKMLNEQLEEFKKQLIQVQLLQTKMEELRAKIASTFGTPTLLPKS